MTETVHSVPGFPSGSSTQHLTRGAIRALGDCVAGIPAEAMKTEPEKPKKTSDDVDPWADNMGKSRY